MQCKCGNELPEEFRFCPACGKPAPKPQNPVPRIADELEIKQVDPMLSPVEAARLLKISRWKLDELRIQKKLPPNCYVIISGKKKKTIRYRAKELLNWAGTVEGPLTTAG
ncbi:zinc-ribbon domain-containing protein [Desulfoscipio geothermicus]|uniref:Zinc-ribbon domain-containing protein n=1 Tax=Desulfoscipio geothermicus DSM 3669 TaxID=1121426 RepID=A0A1I6ECC8_9FIRM|nr:zinc-ribbon domain-containing protein [Desulfoscipio geothermicus]SFR15409.1 hypothetical protein SAMN05660706_13547 [Desulfoscipio geothermicus DSM 3669]